MTANRIDCAVRGGERERAEKQSSLSKRCSSMWSLFRGNRSSASLTALLISLALSLRLTGQRPFAMTRGESTHTWEVCAS